MSTVIDLQMVISVRKVYMDIVEFVEKLYNIKLSDGQKEMLRKLQHNREHYYIRMVRHNGETHCKRLAEDIINMFEK